MTKKEEIYAKILDDYEDYQNTTMADKVYFKRAFFIMSIILLMTPVVLMAFVILGIYLGKINVMSIEGILSVISTLITFVTSIKLIPDTLAPYLFKKDEDDDLMNLINNFQDNPSSIKSNE